MTTIMRHGGGAHVMRPDGVYRTSVLQPMVGYSPQVDVQAVAQAFTQGPPLGGLRGPSWLDRVKAKFAEMRGRSQARFAAMMPGSVNTHEASQAAPQMQSQLDMLARLTRLPSPAQGGATLVRRRFNTYYRAG